MDYLGILHRLRPNSAYLWRDGGSTYADILEWRDPLTTKPTEVECNNEWQVILAERAAADSEQQIIIDAQNNAISDYGNLPTWAKTGTAAQAETYITAQIFAGQTQAQVDAYIDATIKNITTANVAQINAQLLNIRTVLKAASAAIITMRSLFIITAKLLIYIRDLVIRFRK